MRPRYDARLVPSAVIAYACALSIGAGAIGPTWWLAAAAAAAVLLGITRTRGAGSACLACAAAAAVAVACLAAEAARWGGGIAEAIASGDEITFEGTVATEAEPLAPSRYGAEEDRWRVVLSVTKWTTYDQRSRTARAEIVIVGDEEWASVRHGETIRATGVLAPAGPGRPVAVCWRPRMDERIAPRGIAAVVADLRSRFRDATGGLPDEVRGLTIGIVIGDTSAMDERQVDDMRVTGLAHLTAVSGAHFAIVALVLGAASRAARLPRRVRAVVLVVVAAGFVALVFPGASVVRAAWMCAVVAAALWWGRPSQALPSLASAVIGLLLIDPYLALSYGFALSVLATGAIALWSPILAVSLSRFVAPRLARVIAVPLAAQVACAPVIVLMNPGMGVYAVPANLIAVPFVVVTTVLGLASVVVGPILPAAAHGLAALAGGGAWPIALAARAFAHAPLAWLPWPSGVTGALLAAAASTAVVVSTSARRVVGWARIGASIAILAMLAATPQVRSAVAEARRDAPADWAIAACDVGQGDAMLLRAGPHSAVVVDVGPPDGGIVPCLTAHGVRDVPLLVLTHPHADHDGAVRDLLDAVPVGQAWVSPAAGPGRHDRATSALDAAGVPWSVPAPGTVATVGQVRLAAWHAGSSDARSDSEVNDASLATWGQAGGVTVLGLGDLETGGQARLLASGGVPVAVDVLKVAHHGSARQDPGLEAAVRPRVAIVSVGENSYGHPDSGVVEAYRRAGAAVFRTDHCGSVDVENGAPLVVASRCPLGVAGWDHGGTQLDTHGFEGLGPRDASAPRSARRAGDHPRRTRRRRNRYPRSRFGRDRRGHAPQRRDVRERGPPRGDESLPVCRAGRRRDRRG